MKTSVLYFLSFFYLSFLFPIASSADMLPDANPDLFKYERFVQWKNLINDAKNDNEWQMINRVNQFFNQIHYVSDSNLWGESDYWATPTEFLRSNAGDCEDFAIAKYYTLKAMGVDESKMRLTHVIINSTGEAHMILLVQERGSNALLALDNRSNKIMPFTAHHDLSPTYSFNASDLWITESKTEMIKVGKATQIKLWNKLKQRMTQHPQIANHNS